MRPDRHLIPLVTAKLHRKGLLTPETGKHDEDICRGLHPRCDPYDSDGDAGQPRERGPTTCEIPPSYKVHDGHQYQHRADLNGRGNDLDSERVINPGLLEEIRAKRPEQGEANELLREIRPEGDDRS